MKITVLPDDDVPALVSRADGESVTLIIAPGRDSLSMTTVLATIRQLALERSPAMRINAVVATVGTNEADFAATVCFLDSAASITGQVIELV